MSKKGKPGPAARPPTEKKRIHWRQAIAGVLLGTALSLPTTAIRDHYREAERTKKAAWQVVNAWDEETRVNAIALQLKADVASVLSQDPPQDLAQRNRFLAQMRSTKLSSFALKTMAVHFASLDAEGPRGSSAAVAMAQFYRSLERVEKEEADIFPQFVCESDIANVQRFASALDKQYRALKELHRRANLLVDALERQLGKGG